MAIGPFRDSGNYGKQRPAQCYIWIGSNSGSCDFNIICLRILGRFNREIRYFDLCFSCMKSDGQISNGTVA